MKIATLLTRAPDSLVVYVAPYTALATQVAERLEPRLRAANLAEPLIWTGSYEIDPEVQTLGNLLVMTPEKLDSVLRTSLEDDPRSHDLISRLQLVVLDECHALGVGERGLTYELLIARLLRRFPDSEICAMSAVLGNPQALSQWLTGVARSVSVSSWRPTGARLLVYRRDGWVTDHARRNLIRLPGWSSPKNAAAAIAERLVQAGEWPVLILETQRGYAESAAAEAYSRLANLDLPRMSVDRNRSATRAEQELGQDANLGDMIRAGVAFHHAGIPFGLRREIEGLVRNRQLRVLCSTTTLAEGVDLPFRSIICPHLYFEGTPMSRPLFQNIAGRAGRAFVSTEGTVIFLEPGRSEGLQYLYERLLPKDAGPIEAESRLSDVLRSPRRPWEWRLQWCFQAQILGLLGDEQLEAEEISAFIQRTFQYARQPTSATVRPLRRKLERLLEDMESSDPPFAEAASPIRLTAWGRAACLTGLSLDSVRILRRELLRLHDESGSWYEDESWAQRSAPEGLLKEIVWLSLSALESFSRSLRMPPRYGAFGDALRSWIEGDYRVFEDLTAMDWPLLREWLRGTDTRRLADENMMGIRRSTPARQLLELNRYYEARASLLPWMYSAVLRVAKYLEDEEQVAVPDRVGFGVNFLRWGVDSLAGAFLAAELRLPRVAASRLAGSLDFDVESLEDSLMDELASLDQGALEEVIGDRWLAEQTGITLSAIQEP
jgi:hypothetical protein